MRFSFSQKQFFPLLISAISLLVGSAEAQTLTILGGQGQITGPSTQAGQLLTVQLLDAAGRPFPNQQITFADNASGLNGYVQAGNILPTDANGITTATFIGASLNAAVNPAPFVQATILATYGGLTANFTETTVAVGPGGGSLAQINVQSPFQGVTLNGSAGSTGTDPIRVFVGTISSSAGIPNVAVSIAVDPGSGTGTISCKEGPFVLTDTTGVASCTPIFGKVGSGSFTINVGSFISFNRYQFTVVVGPPGMITVTGGDNQSGNPGQRLPLPVVAVVSDLAGNILSGAQVVFESVTPGGVSFQNSVTTSDANGRVSTTVVLGTIPGAVQIRIRDIGNLVANPATVTVRVNISISGLNKVSGDGQTAFIGAAFAQPLVVQVTNAANQPVSSATVQFAVTSGSATVSAGTALTGADGRASTTVTAGSVPGPITVTASTSTGLTQTFQLTANPIGPTNFTYLNGASFVPGQVSPGSIVTIGAQGLVSSNVQGIVGGTLVGLLPYTVAGVSVTIGNVPAPIFYVSNQNGQQSVTVQIPFEVAPAPNVPITIAVAGGGSTNATINILPVAPGLFETVGTDGRRRVVALRSNGTVVTTANPAGRGENVRVFLTGLGSVSPSVPTGSFSPAGSDPVVTSSLVAGIANNGVPIIQAIYARNLIGVYELTVTVPTDTVTYPPGTVAFSVAIQGPNGNVYSQSSAIAIQ